MSSFAEQPETKKTGQKKSFGENGCKPYTTIALVGTDGSGKSSVAKALLASGVLPMKYIYMGAHIESSNIALPTSRLAYRLKVYLHKRSLARSGKHVPEKVTMHGIEHRIDRRGKLVGFGRLLRRI